MMARPPLVSRSTPPVGRVYSNYRPELRYDFWCACAYCGTTEQESHASMEIDHHEPKARRPDLVDVYTNLFYACPLCNRSKSRTWPSPTQMAQGMRFLRIDTDHPDDHLEVRGLRVEPLTPVGEYTITKLRLNRLELCNLRVCRQRLIIAKRRIASALRSLRALEIDHLPRAKRAKVLDIIGDASAAQNALMQPASLGVEDTSLQAPGEIAEQIRPRREWLRRMGAQGVP